MKQKQGLAARLKSLLGSKIDEEFFDDLEDMLIEGDLGAAVSMETVEELKSRVRKNGIEGREEIIGELSQILGSMLRFEHLEPVGKDLSLFLILGVNGVGKTTTIAKLAEYYRQNRGIEKIILAAGDTFRAAAIEQLKILGRRLELPVISQEPGSDPGAVIFDTLASAQSRGSELVLADTAGRMHTRADLVRELSKIDRIVGKRIDSRNYKKVLILDATTGQNALHQAEVFHEAVGVDSVILAKFDSTAKGGIVIPICRKLGIPLSFVGTGEGLGDIEPFSRDSYLDSLLGR
jgi:fused signal recognition particle receptor